MYASVNNKNCKLSNESLTNLLDKSLIYLKHIIALVIGTLGHTMYLKVATYIEFH